LAHDRQQRREIRLPFTKFRNHLRRRALDRETSARFVRRASWGMFVLLATMATCLWLLPIERRAGHRALGTAMELTVIAEFFALIGLALVLRRRLAIQVEQLSADHDLLVEQNGRLEQQNLDLARQADMVDAQSAELRRQANELEARTRDLELSARRIAEAQRVARLGYWEIDSSSGDVYWSDEMYRIAGLEVGLRPVPTDQFLEAVHPDDRERMTDIAARAIEHLAEFTDQYRITAAGGRTRTVQANGRVIVDEHGVRKLVGTVQDVTDRVGLEQQLRRAQKMEALGQLAGGVAHDFNNMLTVIESYSAMLLVDHAANPEARGDIEEIRSAARRAGALTRQLLAFSRQQVLKPCVLDINATIGDVEKMLRRLIDEHIDFRTKLDPHLDLVTADPTQVEQVLMNLVVNARDAMPDGGTLTIETSNVHLDSSFAQRSATHKAGPYVMLAVSDTGSGIPEHVLDHIFEPFFTTKDVGQGTGLGLSTVQGIVEQSGGHVWVYSEPGHGTTFKVYLPRAAEEESVAPIAEQNKPARGWHASILLVEDDSAVRAAAMAVLRRAGHAVIEASNGLEALRIIDGGTPTIDMVISDMVMPQMGGRTLTVELARRLPNVPVLLMSGYTREAIPGQSELHPGTVFIDKPFTPQSLIKTVSEVLDRIRESPDPAANMAAD